MHFDFVLHANLLAQQFFHFVGLHRLTQAIVDFVEPAEDGTDMIDRLIDVALHGLLGVQAWLLRKVTGREAFGQPGFTFKLAIGARHDPQQRAFAGAVFPQHADFRAGIEREPNVFQHFLLAVLFGEICNLVDVFF